MGLMPGGPSYHNNLDSILCTQELARKIPSPVKLAAEDPPLAKFFGDERIMNPRIYVGGCLFDIVEGNPQLLVVLLTTFKYSHYFVVPSSGIIHVILHQVGRSVEGEGRREGRHWAARSLRCHTALAVPCWKLLSAATVSVVSYSAACARDKHRPPQPCVPRSLDSHSQWSPTTSVPSVPAQAADARDICQAYLQAAILRNRMRQGLHLHAGELPELRIALQVSTGLGS